MTSLAQVTGLVSAHVQRDYPRFRAITLQIAANIASKSERGAHQLRMLVKEPEQMLALTPLPGSNGLFSTPSEVSTLDDMVLAPQVRERLDRVVLEHSRRNDLLASGLRPASKILCAGPAGCGKSMAARALAHAVGLPMFRVELHEVISTHMGETAGKLAKVFEHVRSMPAVYLFDEFDALGTDRARLGDGGGAGAEMRRVVNSLLQFIESDRSNSLIVAATNHEQVLDSAMFRRFDETIVFPLPAQAEVTELVRRALGEAEAGIECVIECGAIHDALGGLGHADVCAALARVRKDHLLMGTPIDTAGIVTAIVNRQHNGGAEALA